MGGRALALALLAAAPVVVAPSAPAAARAARVAPDEARQILDSEGGSTAVTRMSDGRWLVPFSATSVGDTLRLAGEISESVVSLPVLDGTVPVSIRARLTASPDVDSGWIEYEGQGAPTRLLPFDALGPHPDNVDVTLDLRGMVPVNGQLRLTIRSRLRSLDPSCVTSLIGAWVELRQAGVVLSGVTAPPQSIAAFMPDLLTHVDLYVPAAPSADELRAALRMAAYATRRALGRNPSIGVHALADPYAAPDVSFSAGVRTIAISNRFAPVAALHPAPSGGVVLMLGGDATTLDRTVRALVSDMGALAAGTVVDVQRFDPIGVDNAARPDSPPTTGTVDAVPDPSVRQTYFTFSELGIGMQRITGLGRLQLPVNLTQSRLGGPIQSLNVHLEGELTPLAKGADATLSLLVGSTLVQSRNLSDFEGDPGTQGTGDGGHLVIEATVPKGDIQREVSLTIVVDYQGPGGQCRPTDIPFMLQLDPGASTIGIEPGQTLTAGFNRFPQTLLPAFDIGIDRLDIGHAALAARLVMALQRASALTLDPTVTTVDDAIASPGSAVVLSAASPALLGALPLLSTNPISVTDSRRVELLRFDANLPHAVLEAFDVDGRDRLLLTWSSGAGAPGAGDLAVSQLLDEISKRTTTFTSLYGDTYLVSQGAPPLSIALRGEGLQRTPTARPPDYLARAKPLLMAAGGGFVFMVGMNRVRKRRLRTRGRSSESGEEEGTDDRVDAVP